MREKSWDAYDDFAAAHPYNVYVRDSMKTKFDRVREKNTLEAYKRFSNEYSESPFVKIAADSIAAMTLKSNNIEDYEYFVTKYPKHEGGGDVWMKFYKMFIQKNGKESTKMFKYSYEDFPHKEMLEGDLGEYEKKSEEKAWRYAQAMKNFEDYHTFINEYPLTDHLQDAIEGIYQVTVQDSVLSQHEYFVDAFPDHTRTEEMWLRLYGMVNDQHGEKAILVFDQKYPDFPFMETLKEDKEAIIEKRKAAARAKQGK